MGKGNNTKGGNDLGGGGGGGGDITPTNMQDMISQRERHEDAVDASLEAMRYISQEYGIVAGDNPVETATFDVPEVMAFYDPMRGNVTINDLYFNNQQALASAYADNVASGFHPKLGDKTAMDAVVAHELGHQTMYEYAKINGVTGDELAKVIVQKSSKECKADALDMAGNISRYATKDNHECIAESVADVYCNGDGASFESKTVVKWLKYYSEKRNVKLSLKKK